MEEQKQINWLEQKDSINFWSPIIEGETLQGVLTKIEEGKYGKKYTILDSFDVENITPSHKVLQNLMRKTKEGDLIKIIFLGEQPPKIRGENPTKMYKVFIGEK